MGKWTGVMTRAGSLIVTATLCCGTVAAQTQIKIGSATGAKGGNATVSVTLAAGGASVAGTINEVTANSDLSFGTAPSGVGACSTTAAKACLQDSECPTGETCTRAVGPNCTVGSGLNKEALFAFTDASHATIRAAVVGVDPPNKDPITDGSTLYTCTMIVSATAADGSKSLTNGNIQVSDPTGTLVAAAAGTDGAVTVGLPGACCGDNDHNNSISTSEATNAVLALINRDTSKNPAADCGGDGNVSTADATKVIQNLVNRAC